MYPSMEELSEMLSIVVSHYRSVVSLIIYKFCEIQRLCHWGVVIVNWMVLSGISMNLNKADPLYCHCFIYFFSIIYSIKKSVLNKKING